MLATTYGPVSLDEVLKKKGEAKKNICKKLGLKDKKPLLAVILDKDPNKRQKEALKEILAGLKNLSMEVVVLGDCEDSNMDYTRKNRQLVLEASDLSLVFSFNDVEEMLINGVIPVSSKRPGVDDYNPNRETGNSFVYKKENPWSIFAALVRATETFKFPYDWKHILRQVLKKD